MVFSDTNLDFQFPEVKQWTLMSQFCIINRKQNLVYFFIFIFFRIQFKKKNPGSLGLNLCIFCLLGSAIFDEANNPVLPFWSGFHSVANELRPVIKFTLKTLTPSFLCLLALTVEMCLPRIQRGQNWCCYITQFLRTALWSFLKRLLVRKLSSIRYENNIVTSGISNPSGNNRNAFQLNAAVRTRC